MTSRQTVKRVLSSAAIGLVITVTVACSPVKTLNALVPSNDYQLHAYIAYGDLPRQKLDVYQPKQMIDKNKPPVVLFYYGGGWDAGDKADYKFVAEAFASSGFVAVIPDYRIYPEVVFPGFMEDPAKAAKWVKTHINEFGGDPDRVFLAGHSAGAHIAVMLSLNKVYLGKEQLKPNDFRGTIGLAGPYDFLPLKSERLKEIFGPEDQRWKSQPIEFVTGNNPPMLLLVGLKDGTVGIHNTFNLAAKIKSKGGSVQVVEFPNYGHKEMVAKLAKPLRGNGELLKPIAEFIRAH
ncbi:MAG TPA: alpha/beta hydrolase [Methylotenera sp.]|nr:alpha/beta hydrolase [Methylotenera sp.]